MLAEPSAVAVVRLTDPASRSSRWGSVGKTADTSVVATRGKVVVNSAMPGTSPPVKVIWTAARTSEGVSVACTVTAPPGFILESVTTPSFRLRAAVNGDRDRARLFMPGGDGFVATHAGMVKNPWAGRTYPGWASMQFMALYGRGGGLTVQGRDSRALPRAFEAPYQSSSDLVEMRVVHQLPFAVGRGFSVPPMVLMRCGEGWQSAAALYKAWARKQWWAKRKSGAARPPRWLDKGMLTVGGHLRPLGIGKLSVEYDRWPEVVRAVKEAFGVPSVMLDLREWEHDGIYTSPYYFPLYPSDDVVRGLLASVKPHGARATAMVSGLQWVIERKAYTTDTYNVTAFDGRDRFEREGRPVCVVNRDGETDIAEPYFTWDGRKARMCPNHPFTQAHFPNVARRLAEAGFAMFEFDQMNGGQCPPCYSRDHGHDPGPGVWMREAIARFMAETRKAGRAVNLEFATSIEDPCEVYLPHLDAYISRTGHVSEWPANGEGTEVVPAFAFVYNPLARPMCIDIQHSVNPDPYQLILTARSFAGGAIPSTNLGLFGVLHKYGKDNLQPMPEKLDADQRALLSSVARARGGPLLRFVNVGEMIECAQPDVQPVVWRYQVWEQDRMVEKSLIHPPVLAGAWRLGTGETAYAFVNIGKEPARFDYDWRASVRPRGSARRMSEWINDRPGRTQAARDRSEIVVPPLSVLTVAFSAGRG